jgi:succinate dehydrogenase/fumarate reductase flavoprotein subunit
MNPPAISIYRAHGVDIARKPLEIAVCAQHNNGGFKGNIWWESNVRHLFPVGEVNGSHGVRRPGGSALNSGQVGSLRAAQFISRRYYTPPPEVSTFISWVRGQVEEKFSLAGKMLNSKFKDRLFIERTRNEIQERMSACGAVVRVPGEVEKAALEAWGTYKKLKSELRVRSAGCLPDAFKNLDLCLTHALYLEAIAEYLRKGGKSRGSYLVPDSAGVESCPGLGGEWRFSLNREGAFVDQKILEISLDEKGTLHRKWVEIRPIPRAEGWFENVWKEYREDRIVREEECA